MYNRTIHYEMNNKQLVVDLTMIDVELHSISIYVQLIAQQAMHNLLLIAQ